jgi:hypothetical protein
LVYKFGNISSKILFGAEVFFSEVLKEIDLHSRLHFNKGFVNLPLMD